MLERLIGGKHQFSTILANKNSLQDVKCQTARITEEFKIHFEALHILKLVHRALSIILLWWRPGIPRGWYPSFHRGVCICLNIIPGSLGLDPDPASYYDGSGQLNSPRLSPVISGPQELLLKVIVQ